MPAHVPAAARTMAIIDLFCRERRDLSNSDVARALGMAETSSLDLLHTLQQTGYLLRTARTRRFYPTGRLLWAAQEIVRHDPRLLAATEAVVWLADRTGETAICGVLDEGAVTVIAASQGRHQLRYVIQPGERLALNVSALARAMLAESDPAEVVRQLTLRPLPRLTDKSLTSPDAVIAAIAAQRDARCYTVEDESVAGVTAFAAAGRVGIDLVALSIAGPSARFAAERDRYVDALVEAVAFSAPPAR